MTDLLSITGYIIGVGGAFAILFSKTKNDNLSDLKDRVEILEQERDRAREEHLDNQRAIANLNGQLSTYKEVPLKSIASSLEQITISNAEILNTLKKRVGKTK